MDKDKEAQWNPHPEIDELPVIKCLPVCNFVWISLVTILIVLHWSATFDDGATLTPLQRPTQQSNTFMVPFNVVGKKKDFVLVPLIGPLKLDQVEKYELCCRSTTISAFSCFFPKSILKKEAEQSMLSFFVGDERWVGAACVITLYSK